ncbi:MAG: glycerol-3-phosphate responsive antiterminator GlpP [Paenibacillaceae bacterium]|jgi:glycerol uptake operon antiterminator|nr:glycerol-3-phosphate responsive antiterminator GlpP [Paenibacillaceae bacterium]
MKEWPVIASVTREKQIPSAADSKVERVILMAGTIMTLDAIMKRMHKKGKKVYLHTEMVGGIGKDASAVEYLVEMFGINGIVSTKSSMITAAKQAGIPSIQRVFAIDSAAVDTAIRMVRQCRPDEVEMMPGLMPRVIRTFKEQAGVPLIAGGLIRNRDEVQAALAAGADFVSIGDESFWQ